MKKLETAGSTVFICAIYLLYFQGTQQSIEILIFPITNLVVFFIFMFLSQRSFPLFVALNLIKLINPWERIDQVKIAKTLYIPYLSQKREPASHFFFNPRAAHHQVTDHFFTVPVVQTVIFIPLAIVVLLWLYPRELPSSFYCTKAGMSFQNDLESIFLALLPGRSSSPIPLDP